VGKDEEAASWAGKRTSVDKVDRVEGEKLSQANLLMHIVVKLDDFAIRFGRKKSCTFKDEFSQ
jgi:hypothetical protein